MFLRSNITRTIRSEMKYGCGIYKNNLYASIALFIFIFEEQYG